MGGVIGYIWEEVLIFKVGTNPTVIQHEDERDRSNNIPHEWIQVQQLIYTNGDQLWRRSESPCPPSSLPTSLKVFCATFANNYPRLNLNKIIVQVLTEDIQRKSMGLTIYVSIEAHHSIKFIDRSSWSREQVERTGQNTSWLRKSSQRTFSENRWDSPSTSRQKPTTQPSWSTNPIYQENTSKNSQPGDFCTRCKKEGHSVPIVGRSRRRRVVGNSSRSQDSPLTSRQKPSIDQVDLTIKLIKRTSPKIVD